MSLSELEKTFLEHLPLIERVCAHCARRSAFSPEDSEDFLSWVRLRLIEDEYAVLRKFGGASQLSTYLTVVIQNLARDYRDHLWGRYRSSAQARRLGATAEALERLMVRDGYELDEAIRLLRSHQETDRSEEELRELAAQLPVRTRRQFVGAEVLERQGVEGEAESRVAHAGSDEVEGRLREVLRIALGRLSAQDLLILEMHFGDGLSIADIAHALHLEQRPLYRRRQQSLRALRAALEEAGIGWDEVEDLLAWERLNLEVATSETSWPSLWRKGTA